MTSLQVQIYVNVRNLFVIYMTLDFEHRLVGPEISQLSHRSTVPFHPDAKYVQTFESNKASGCWEWILGEYLSLFYTINDPVFEGCSFGDIPFSSKRSNLGWKNDWYSPDKMTNQKLHGVKFFSGNAFNASKTICSSAVLWFKSGHLLFGVIEVHRFSQEKKTKIFWHFTGICVRKSLNELFSFRNLWCRKTSLQKTVFFFPLFWCHKLTFALETKKSFRSCLKPRLGTPIQVGFSGFSGFSWKGHATGTAKSDAERLENSGEVSIQKDF